MPSTYTTRLRLTLPATGELTNTWGTTVNTGITELVDASIAGAATLSTWGGAGVAYTLSNNNGVTDEARCMFIVASGSPGEAKNIICPAVSKLYVVKNEVTGGFSVTLKTAAGTGITVENGKTAVLRCDGTNVVDAITQLPAFALAGGTVNGVVYLNASRTLTTGSALTFNGTTLANGGAADGTNAITATGNTVGGFIALRPDGTNGQAIRIGGSGAGADILRFLGTADTEYMRLNSTGLGIGTSSPATKLHVNTGAAGYGVTIAASAQTSITYQLGIDSNSNLAIYDTNAAAQRLVLSNSGNLGLGVPPSAWGSNYKGFEIVGGGAGIAANGSNAVTIGTGNYINSAGNWIYTTTGTAVGRYELNSGLHRWYTAPSGTAGNAISFTQAMTLDASGNLLVGTTSTGADGLGIRNTLNLTFAEGSGTSYANLFRQTSSGATVIANGYKWSNTANGFASSIGTSWAKTAIGLGVGTGAITFYADPAGTVANGTDVTPSERARITSAGDLVVGNIASYNNSIISSYPGTSRNGLGVSVDSTVAGTYTGVYINRTASDGPYLVFDRGATRIGTIDVSGTSLVVTTNNVPRLTISSTGAITSSDLADAVGYKGTPINEQLADYTLVMADQGKTILHPIADNNARTFTIPANGAVAFPVGTVITFINLINTVTISINSDTMYLAGTGATGSRTLAAYGMASAIKVSGAVWVISGNGLT